MAVLYVNIRDLTSHAFQLRVCHKLTNKLKREVVLGSSSLDDPPQFITVSSFCIYKLNFFHVHENEKYFENIKDTWFDDNCYMLNLTEIEADDCK